MEGSTFTFGKDCLITADSLLELVCYSLLTRRPNCVSAASVDNNMDLLCGCVSGKKSKSAGGKKAKKGKKADKPAVSTKGQTQHGGAEKGELV